MMVIAKFDSVRRIRIASAYKLQLLRKWREFVLPTVLCLIAFLYYGQYYDCGFNYADEGNIALISKRFFEGMVPYREVALAAGVLWPYSVAFVFWLCGVNFIAMKVYFFGVTTATALMGYATVARVQSSKLLGLIAGILLILSPGTLHKAYIPFGIVVNMYFLTRIDLNERPLKMGQVAAASAVIAVTFLLRGDLGLCAAAVFLALVLYHTLSEPNLRPKSLLKGVRVFGIALGGFVTVLLPFFLMATVRGFLQRLTTVMFGKVLQLIAIVKRALNQSDVWRPSGVPNDAGTLLARLPIDAIWENGSMQIWAILTYLPVMILFILLTVGVVTLIRRKLQGRPMVKTEEVPLLVLFFLGFGAFPQFFLNRPDAAHLSQFMPGYIVLSIVLVGRFLPKEMEITTQMRRLIHSFMSWQNVPGIFVVVALMFNLCLYVDGALSHPSTGSIAVKDKDMKLFTAENGVRVRLTTHTHKGLTRVKNLIESYSTPDDFVVCFPYAPGFNFMTDRPSFMRQLYADDSWLIDYPSWQDETVEKILIEKPAMVIINDWAINETEISRFPNWATDVYECVVVHYIAVDTILNNAIYVRRDIARDGDVRSAELR